MKILSWNIAKSTFSTFDEITTILKNYDSDIIILQEYVESNGIILMCDQMKLAGWKYQLRTELSKNEGCILIMSKVKFSTSRCNYNLPVDQSRWVDLIIDDGIFSLLVVNIPHNNNSDIYKRIIEFAKIKSIDKYLIVGNFNITNKRVNDIKKYGWIDTNSLFTKESDEHTEGQENENLVFASRFVCNQIMKTQYCNEQVIIEL